MEQERYIQVGVTSMRDPKSGDFLPAVPLYIRADDCAEASEEKLRLDLGKLFAERIREYVDGCRTEGVPV